MYQINEADRGSKGQETGSASMWSHRNQTCFHSLTSWSWFVGLVFAVVMLCRRSLYSPPTHVVWEENRSVSVLLVSDLRSVGPDRDSSGSVVLAAGGGNISTAPVSIEQNQIND